MPFSLRSTRTGNDPGDVSPCATTVSYFVDSVSSTAKNFSPPCTTVSFLSTKSPRALIVRVFQRPSRNASRVKLQVNRVE